MNEKAHKPLSVRTAWSGVSQAVRISPWGLRSRSAWGHPGAERSGDPAEVCPAHAGPKPVE